MHFFEIMQFNFFSLVLSIHIISTWPQSPKAPPTLPSTRPPCGPSLGPVPTERRLHGLHRLALPQLLPHRRLPRHGPGASARLRLLRAWPGASCCKTRNKVAVLGSGGFGYKFEYDLVGAFAPKPLEERSTLPWLSGLGGWTMI